MLITIERQQYVTMNGCVDLFPGCVIALLFYSQIFFLVPIFTGGVIFILCVMC